MMKQLFSQIAPQETQDREDAVLNKGMLEQMMAEMPLWALCNFGNMTQEQLDEMIRKL